MRQEIDGSQRFLGVYRGQVVNNKDPQKLRRVKLTVPLVTGDQPTDWAWPKDQSATYAQLPAVGQGVMVMFEGGDPSHPIWLGTFGKYQGKGHPLYLGEVSNSDYALAGTTWKNPTTGGTDIDLARTLLKMMDEIYILKGKVATLEAQMPIALQNGL